MLSAMVLLPTSVAIAKLLTSDYSPEQITWIRCLVQALVAWPLLVRAKERLSFGRLHLARGVMFFLMGVPFVTALIWMPLADAQALFFTFPVMVMAFSALVLGQPVGPVRWACAAAGMIGVVLVIQPGFRELSPGIGLCLLSAVAAAAFILLTRRLLSDGASPVGLLVMPALMSVVLLTPFLPLRWAAPDAADLALLITAGVTAVVSNFLLNFAYSRIDPSRIAPLAYLQVVFGVALGWWLFDELPDWVGGCGIAIIVATGVLIAIREHDQRR